MYILGINSAYHESAACLLRDAHLVAAAEEERFTRIKHAKRATVNNPDELPLNAITFCLEKAGLSSEQGLELSEISHIGFSLDPEKRYASNIQHIHPYALDPADFGGLNGERIFYSKIMSVPRKLRALRFNGKFHFLNHHICHAASVFYPTPFQKAAVAVTDGIGEFATTTLYRGCDNSLDVISESSYPNSLGFLWEKVSEHLGFSEYDGAKIMALAAFGDPAVYRDAFAKIVDGAGHFQVDDSIVRYRTKDFGPLSALFGLEKRSTPISTVGR